MIFAYLSTFPAKSFLKALEIASNRLLIRAAIKPKLMVARERGQVKQARPKATRSKDKILAVIFSLKRRVPSTKEKIIEGESFTNNDEGDGEN